MKRLSVADTEELKNRSVNDFAGQVTFLGFTYHFSLKSLSPVKRLMKALKLKGFKRGRVSDEIDHQFILEAESDQYGDRGFLEKMDVELTELSSSFEGVTYLGATPICSGKPKKNC